MPTGPLLRVWLVELMQLVAGPFAGSLFADLSADIAQIQRPDGEAGRPNLPNT